jgi:hypothetical protein
MGCGRHKFAALAHDAKNRFAVSGFCYEKDSCLRPYLFG